MTDYGCEQCCGEAPPSSWVGHLRLLETTAQLKDESHFSLAICACRLCGQKFVYVWTEFIDWKDGDDAQYSTLVPIEEAELDTVLSMGDKIDLAYISSLGNGRRHLDCDKPTGKPRRLRWAKGAFVVWEGY